MADKIIAILWCLFIVIFLVPSSLTASERVPDGVVYTEVKKTLVEGFQGVLTCRFHRDPIAVYWEKGPDPDNRNLMVVWHNGKVSGPRFADGSYDIDNNYSLIINNVSVEDAGRMYCKVSNYNGILIDNYTDISVTDTPVVTKPHATLQMRKATYGILQCIVHIKVKSIAWKRVTTSTANDSLIIIANNQDAAEVNGTSYGQDIFNITQDYSLVIREVQVHHEGIYICEVTDFDTGISFRNETLLSVVAQPLAPFPTIQECLNTYQYDSTYEYCILDAESEMTLACEANGYYPTLHLYFLHESKEVELLETRALDNGDGTKNKTITIVAKGSKELYTCVASNIPGMSEDQSTSVLLHGELKFDTNVLLIIGLVILLALLIPIPVIAFFLWKRRRNRTRYSSVSKGGEDTGTRHSSMSHEMKDVKDLPEEELKTCEQHVDRVLLNHYRTIHDMSEPKDFQAEVIIEEIKISLFDSKEMLTDWQTREKSSSSQPRRLNHDVFNRGDKTDYVWPSNDELKSIADNLTRESLGITCKKLGPNNYSKSVSSNGEIEILDILLEWRNKLEEKSLEEKHKQLSSVFGSLELKGLIPVLKGVFIYKAELVDLAFQMIIQDLQPVSEALGIPFARLVSYRPEFQSSHLNIGTIKLIINLLTNIKKTSSESLESGERRTLLCTKLGKRHRKAGSLGMCVYDMSYGELFRIAGAMMQASENMTEGSNVNGGKDDEMEETEIASEQMLEEEKNESKTLREQLNTLRRVLQLTDEDIESSNPVTTYTLLKIWKEKPRQSAFNYRAALAYQLRQNKMSGLADEVAAGNFINEHTSLEFIQKIIKSQDQLRILGDLLQLSKGNDHWHTNTPLDDATEQICRWVAGWTKKMKGSAKPALFVGLKKLKDDFIDITPFTPMPQTHRDLNDRLVENGFLALASEIMIIEQQLARM